VKPVVFLGDALNRLHEFPERARREAGFQLDRVQRGLDPDDWKPIATVGLGVREIRVRDATGAFRVVYVTTFLEAVFVLHVFQKKTQRTLSRDLELANSRFRALKHGASR
jgi:phage-related protein